MVVARLGFATLMIGDVTGHGQITYPPSTRQGPSEYVSRGSLDRGCYCLDDWGPPEIQNYSHNFINGACLLFSQPSEDHPDLAVVSIPPTVNDPMYRTVNPHVQGGETDWTRAMPWRAPGWAAVDGSGCGSAGGGPVWQKNGGWPARGMTQGQDPLTLAAPENIETTWKAGSVVEVAWGVKANHGGGYNWRLCLNVEGEVSEECFQKTPLKFASEKQWLHKRNGMRFEVPRVTVREGTFPEGSEWGRIAFPECDEDRMCTDEPHECEEKRGTGDTCHELSFPEPIPFVHGFGHDNNTAVMGAFHDYSIVDNVIIPDDLPTGDYLLSWRWDCESTQQIWQNCADVRIEASEKPSPPPAPLDERCDLTGTWTNLKGGHYNPDFYRVNITQEAASWTSECIEGACGCCAKAVGGVASPYGDFPQGGSTIYAHLVAFLSTGNFTTAPVKGAPKCSQIDWEDGNSWCREPFCPSAMLV